MAGLAYRFRVRTSGGSEIAALKLAVNVGETLLQLVDQSVKLFPSQPFGFQLAHLTQNLGQAPRQGGVRIKSFEATANMATGPTLGGATRQIGRSLPLPIIENAMLSIEQMQICKNCTDSIPW